MANSGFLRSLVSSPTKITTKFVVKPSQILVTRPFSSIVSNPNSNPPIISPDSVTQITRIDPFYKEPVNEKKVVEEFFKARTDGLFVTGASKMVDRMAKRLRPFHNNRKTTHQAIDRCRGPNRTPDVIAHIAVFEAYANAGQTHQGAYRVYLKMLGPGIIPNQHTYNMLIQLLAGASTSSGDWMMIKQAQKYIFEMLDKGMMPDAPTSVAIFKALAKEGRLREGEEFLEDLKARGWVVDDKVFREVLKGRSDPIRVLKGKGGHLIKVLFDLDCGKWFFLFKRSLFTSYFSEKF